MFRRHVYQGRVAAGEQIGADAVEIDGDAVQAGAGVGIGATRQMVAGVFQHHLVAGPQQHMGGDVQRLLPAVHQDHLVRRHGQSARGGQPSGDGIAQSGAAGRMFLRQPCAKAIQRTAQQRAPAGDREQRRIGAPDSLLRRGAMGTGAVCRRPRRWPGGPCEVGFREFPADPLVRRPVRSEPCAVCGPIAALRRPAAVWTAGHEGSPGGQSVQVALGDQPFIGQQHGDAGDGKLLRHHAGGWHSRARLQPGGGNQCLQLLVELLLQRLVSHQLEGNQQRLVPRRTAQDDRVAVRSDIGTSPPGSDAKGTFARRACRLR